MQTTTIIRLWKKLNGKYRQHNHRRPDGLTHQTIRERHFDPIYGVGYYYGWMDADYDRYENDSASAWLDAITNGHVTDGISDHRNI